MTQTFSSDARRTPSTSTWLAVGAGLAAALLIGLIAFAATGGNDDKVPASAESTTQPEATAEASPSSSAGSGDAGEGYEDGGPGGGQSGSGSSGSGSSGGDQDGGSGSSGSGSGDGDGGGASGNEPPYIRDLYPDAYVYDDEGETLLAASMQGHAYDPDGPDEQEAVQRLEIEWGDGTTTTARLEGHGAFRDAHDYDHSYAGQTVTVTVVAYGHDGQTATDTVELALPTL